MLPNHEYPIPQREPLIRIIRSPSTSGSKGKGQFCCQQYACAHQDNAEWVVGWHFEHRWLLFQKEPQARVRARLGPRARAWVRRTYARPPGRESIRKPVTLWRLDINVTAGGISSSAVSRACDTFAAQAAATSLLSTGSQNIRWNGDRHRKEPGQSGLPGWGVGGRGLLGGRYVG